MPVEEPHVIKYCAKTLDGSADGSVFSPAFAASCWVLTSSVALKT